MVSIVVSIVVSPDRREILFNSTSSTAHPLLVCCTVCSPYLPGYQHCPRSLTRLTYHCLVLPCLHLQLTHPALPALLLLPNRVSYLMIVTYLPRISALLSQTPQPQLTTFCLVIISQTNKSLPAQFCPPCISKISFGKMRKFKVQEG